MVEYAGAKLVAILRADVVGSTEFLATRGIEAAIASRSRSSDAIDRAGRDGMLLDRRGDGTLLGFATVGQAVAAAAELQRVSAAADDFSLRVAVMLHELVVDQDIYASVDRRTALIESLCPPGEVVVGARAARAIRASDGFTVEPLTETPDGTVVYRLVESLVPLAPAGRRGSGAGATTLLRAVLFSDLAPAPDDAEEVSPSVVRQLSERCVVANGGEVVDTNGAGSVALFTSCTAAMNAADAIQIEARSAALRADGTPGFWLSVGIAVGDIATSDQGPIGLAVVEAARLLAMAARPSVLVTADVAALDAMTGRATTPEGPVTMKGIPDPVQVRRRDGLDVIDTVLAIPAALARQQRFPLVGRSKPAAALRRLWDASVAGSVRGAVVSGEEGVGKTRLVSELAKVVHASGGIVLHGACDEDLRVPYAPLAEALAGAVAIDPELAAAAAGEPGPLAVLLDAALAGRSGHRSAVEAAASRPLDRFELFDAATDALQRLATGRPVLVVIDDLHWGEQDTVDMIEEILAVAEPFRVAVVATCRAEHLGRQQPVKGLLQSSRCATRVEHLRLDRLTGADVQAMLGSQTSEPLEPEVSGIAGQISHITGGSPLYIEELVGHLVAAGELRQLPDGGWSPATADDLAIPDSVVDLVAQRADRLGPETVEVLATAAILGASFEVEVLADVTERTVDDILDAVEAADQAKLIGQSEDGGICTFSDEIVREALMRTRRPARRAVEHRKIAEVLERTRPNQIDRLAAHWSSALGADARSKAVHYLRLVGDRDMKAAAWELSADRHRRVLALLASDEAGDDVALGEVHYALGASLRKLGDAAYRPELIKAAELARRTGQADLLARSAIAMMRPGAWYPEAAVVDEDIVAMCEDALLLMGPADPLRPRVLAALAVNLTYGDNPTFRAELVAEAQTLAAQSGDRGLVGTALAAELIAFPDPHLFERRRELADEVRRIGRATGDRDLLFVGSWFVVIDLMALGEIDAAAQIVDELSTVVGRTREYWPSFLVSHFKTAMAIARCDVDASEAIEEERSLFEHQPVDWFGVSVIQSAVVAMGRGTLSDMLLSLVAAAGEYDQDSWARKWNYALSRAYLEANDFDAALAAIAMNPDPDLDYYWLASTYHLGLVGLLTDDPEICRTVIRKLSPFRGRITLIGLGACFSGQVSTALGQACLGLGRLDEAEELLRESMAQADGLSFPYFATIARRFLAQTIQVARPGDPEVRTLLVGAAAVAERYGLALEERELRLMINDITGVTNR